MKFLADTDLIIQHLRRVQRATARIGQYTQEGLGLSIASLAELYEGVYSSPDSARTEALMTQFLDAWVTVLDIDQEVCRIFGVQRLRLRRAGRLIGDLDLLIGSTALRHGLGVLTNNRRHFELIEGLEIESW